MNTPDNTHILDFIWSLVQIQPAALVYIAVIVLGYVLKLSPEIDNRTIPRWTIPISAIVYLSLCIPPQMAGDGLSIIRYMITTLILGCAVGLVAWATHAWGLRYIEDRLPVLGPALKSLRESEESTNPAATADGQPKKEN